MSDAYRDSNYVPTLIGVSSVDGQTPTRIEANPVTNALFVEVTGGTANGYITDGVDTGIIATVKDLTNSNPLITAIVDGNGDQITSFGGGTQYDDGDADVTPTGTVAMGTDGSNVFALTTDAAGHLQVDVLSGGGGGTLVKDNEAVDLANDTGVLILGNDGSNYQILAVDASGNLQVDLVTAAVTNAGTFATQVTGDALTALQLIDNAISGSGFNITQLGGANVPIGAGLEATALRVTLATDSTGVVSIDDNGGTITVDGTVAVTNAGITTIASAVSGTEMQVDVLTMPTVTVNAHAVTNAGTFAVQVDGSALTALQLIDNAVSGAGFNITQLGGAAVPIGAGLEATALRVTLATDSTGVVSIDDNGGALTVDGTVAVTNADLTSIKTAVEIMDDWDDANYCNVNLNIAGTDVAANAGVLTAQTLRVTIATDDEVNNLLGTIDTDTSNMATSLGNLDNSVDGNYLNVNMNIAGADVSGTVPVPTRLADFEFAGVTTHVKKYYTNAGAVTDGIIWSPAAGKRWYVTDLIIQTSAAAVITLEDDLAGVDSSVMKFELAANSGVSHAFNTPLFSGEDAADLIITTTAGNIYVTAVGYEI